MTKKTISVRLTEGALIRWRNEKKKEKKILLSQCREIVIQNEFRLQLMNIQTVKLKRALRSQSEFLENQQSDGSVGDVICS